MKIKRIEARMLAAVMLLALSAVVANAQLPQITNAKTETRAAAADFSAQLRNAVQSRQEPAWFGYAVPAVAGDHQMCCGSYEDGQMIGCGACRLEDSRNSVSTHSSNSSDTHAVKLEGPQQLVVMLRAEHGAVGRIRTFSEDCQLDAGGLPVIWFTGVSGSASVAALTPFVNSDDGSEGDHVGNSALAAIALTGDPSAGQALKGFVAPAQPERRREQAAFWLGAARGHAGYELLQQLARGDSSDDLRAKVAFALYVSKDPAAVDEIIRMAKNDQSTHVRGQAIFWIAQKAGKKAAATITDVIENDPNTEVKKRAVFALSQLPRDEGVPLLINVAKTNANPAVR
ncbi:MAG TPA: hypothetical protein VFW94_13700, partial [Candidatus Acidoferrales bacterium]|nr:hypothetical protein [Candidatus Acidoferrales bacterium]